MLAVLLALALLTSACAGQTEEAGKAPAGTGPGVSTPAPPQGKAPVPDTPTGVRLRGVLSAGVEPGCMLLETADGERHLLLGGDRSALRAGEDVEVSGVSRPATRTTCQEGTPFQVRSVRPL